jgi:hypothetical protein
MFSLPANQAMGATAGAAMFNELLKKMFAR